MENCHPFKKESDIYLPAIPKIHFAFTTSFLPPFVTKQLSIFSDSSHTLTHNYFEGQNA